MREYPITIFLLVANVAFSFMGFNRPGFLEKFKFEVGAILRGKEFYRMITSGFLHVSGSHLFMNMISLYFMGRILEELYVIRYGYLGMAFYLIAYFGSMIGGDVLALLLKRNHPQYSAVGASGAISGIIFALLVIMPYGEVSVFFILPMPFWLFGVLYVVYSLFGIRTGFANIGHEAHLGGALIGLILGSLFALDFALDNWILITCLTIPTALLLYLLYHNPSLTIDPMATLKRLNWGGKRNLPPSNPWNNPNRPVEVRPKQDGLEINMKAKLQAEMDALLDKVSRKGIDSLTLAERKRLDELAKYLNHSGYKDGGRAPTD